MTGDLRSSTSWLDPVPLLLVLLMLAIATAPPAGANEQGDAVALVETVHQAAMTLGRGGPAETQRRTISAAFDGNGIARAVLGKSWGSTSRDDRAAVVDALLDAIVRGLADRLGRTRDYNFVVLGTKVLTNGDILVRSEFRRPVRRPTSVDWRIRHCGSRLCIGDVLVDGGSVTVQQRDRVAARLASNGGSIPALVVDLRKGRL